MPFRTAPGCIQVLGFVQTADPFSDFAQVDNAIAWDGEADGLATEADLPRTPHTSFDAGGGVRPLERPLIRPNVEGDLNATTTSDVLPVAVLDCDDTTFRTLHVGNY